MERETGMRSRMMQTERKTVETPASGSSTSLKRGVNERDISNGRKRFIICVCLCFVHFALRAAESWEVALSRMPIATGVRELNRTNCVDVMLRAFQSNVVVKALI